ncbi:hypothetical protein CRUP_030735, partial [Coryphaenoides rupestris]
MGLGMGMGTRSVRLFLTGFKCRDQHTSSGSSTRGAGTCDGPDCYCRCHPCSCSEQVSTRTHWGLIQVPLSVRDVGQMREMYAELGLTTGQLGIDDQANLHPDLFESVHVRVGKKALRSYRYGPVSEKHVLMCFSRDTAILGHFLYNSASPPKSFIQGKGEHEECAVVYPPNGVIPFHGFSMY